MFVNSPNHPLEFAVIQPASTSPVAAPARTLPRRGPSTVTKIRANVVRLIPGLTPLPPGSDRLAA